MTAAHSGTILTSMNILEAEAADGGERVEKDTMAKLRSILKASQAKVRTMKSCKKVSFASCDLDGEEYDDDGDFVVEFRNECSVEILVNKISALTFSNIGESGRGQKYVLNCTSMRRHIV